MFSDRPCEPWLSFLSGLDAQLDEVVDLHCIGGFVVSQLYGFARETADLALTKLERSNDRDIRDVKYLAHAGLIQRDTLVSRYEEELEPYITGRTPTWHRTTLGLDECWPESSAATG